jgi:hypothetical protein
MQPLFPAKQVKMAGDLYTDPHEIHAPWLRFTGCFVKGRRR